MPRRQKTPKSKGPVGRPPAITINELDADDYTAPPDEEFVVQPNGQVRQAGATTPEDGFVDAFRAQCEADLFTLLVGVLGYDFLTPSLHLPLCRFLQRVPPQRKMLITPRDHGKTTMVPRGVPIHMWIQPSDRNIYFPGQPGASTRILLAGETETMAKGNLRVVRTNLEQNDLLRALWPHIMWDNPRRDAKVWNDGEFIIRRPTEFAESSLDAVGVGGARTGKHPNVLMKDDITTEAAANSQVVMQTAIDWHTNSRALLPPWGLEFITGTYWAPDDLPHYVERDPSVQVNKRFRSIVDGAGKLIWPEYITPEKVDELMREYGPRFHLLYMNHVLEGSIVDFARSDLRFFDLEGETLLMATDERDDALLQSKNELGRSVTLQTLMSERAKPDRDADVTSDTLRMRALRRPPSRGIQAE